MRPLADKVRDPVWEAAGQRSQVGNAGDHKSKLVNIVAGAQQSGQEALHKVSNDNVFWLQICRWSNLASVCGTTPVARAAEKLTGFIARSAHSQSSLGEGGGRDRGLREGGANGPVGGAEDLLMSGDQPDPSSGVHKQVCTRGAHHPSSTGFNHTSPLSKGCCIDGPGGVGFRASYNDHLVKRLGQQLSHLVLAQLCSISHSQGSVLIRL